MVIFFTLPPDPIDYPYVLINANNPLNGLRYIMSHRRSVEIVIIDSGVEIFRNPKIKDYPGGAESWIQRLVHLYDRVRNILGQDAKVYVTCCDYPDDYHHRQLWIDDRITNIERTIFNILTCVDWYNDVRWLIPIQGWNKRPSTLIWSLEYLHELGILEKYHYLAIANLCVELNTRIVRHGLMYVRTWLFEHGYHNHRIHVFGMKINALKHVIDYLNSFDSTAWTRPVSKRLHDVFPWSAKTEEERVLFFCEYLLHLARYGATIPMDTLKQCFEHVTEMSRSLPRRYPSRDRAIIDLLATIESDLTKMLG